jgi:protein TonB
MSSSTRSGMATAPLGVIVSVLLHGVATGALLTVNRSWLTKQGPDTVELEVVEQPPPPPDPRPPPPPLPEPPPPPKPHKVALRPPPKVIEPPAAPPPPNREPPPDPPDKPPPPVFGVSLESTVGEAGMAVPVGNTLMTKDRTPAPPSRPAAPLPASAGPPSFSPVSDLYVAKIPVVLKEVKAEFPAEARRLGVEGFVDLLVGVDHTGRIRSVKPTRRAGYGFDEAAIVAMWRFQFSPAVSNDGKPVDYVLKYRHRFTER